MNGMAGNEDGDAFFDDDFLDISDHELQRLEQDAISFTQQERAYTQPQEDRPALRSHAVSHAQKLNTSEYRVQDGGRSNGDFRRNHGTGPVSNLHQESSDVTMLDEDGLPLVIEERPQNVRPTALDETAQREQWRANRFAQQQNHVFRTTQQAQRQALLNNQVQGQSQSDWVHLSQQAVLQPRAGVTAAYRGAEEDGLRARIAELMREKNELNMDLNVAKEEVHARRGEISNIRAKQLQDDKAHEKQLAALQKSKQEEHEKLAASIRAVNAEKERIASEMKFLKAELKEEARKAQVYQRQLKERPLHDKPNNINTTPKRHHALRDGFDEDEIMQVSPIKSGGRKSKQTTPTANRKRKQPADANVNHIQPLVFRLSGTSAPADNHQVVQNTSAAPPTTVNVKPDQWIAIVQKNRLTRRHLKLVQNVTNFRPLGSKEVLIEQLFRLSFPSDQGKSLGSIVVDAMAKLSVQRLPGDLVQIFIDLWSRARTEGYHICLSLLIEAISFILDQDPLVVDVALLDGLLPIIQSTFEINASARFQLMRKDWLNDESKAKPTIDPHIDNTACLQLCYTIACLVSDDAELLSRFWRCISTDSILAMLNACQPIPQITLMLQMLATSILPETFAMICTPDEQKRFETYICDRICWLLWDPFKADPEAERRSYSQREICFLRQESLNLLTKLTLGSSSNPFNPSSATNHGTIFLATHPSAISRLVRCVYDELALAYSMTPTQHLHIRLVNTAVRILHFVLFSPTGRQLDWQTKTNAVNGGAYKFRVVMARLAYAESTEPGIDAGISDDTVRMATELLEESITPDEADDLIRVFEGEGSSGNSASRRTSGIGSTQRT